MSVIKPDSDIQNVYTNPTLAAVPIVLSNESIQEPEKWNNEVNSYEELVEALKLAEDDIKYGRTYTEVEIWEHLNKLRDK
jgi:hypothetical protein